MNLRLILFFTTIIVYSKDIQSQGFTWDRFTKNDGLLFPNSTQEIFQDNKGYLILCSENSITRFDGLTFINFRDVSNPNAIYPNQLTILTNEEFVFNTYNSLGKLNFKTGTFQYEKNDSCLTLQFDSVRHGIKDEGALINNKGYRIFSRDRSHKYSNRSNDTLFYQYNGKISWLIIPKGLVRDFDGNYNNYRRDYPSKCLFADHKKNIYIKLIDTLNLRKHYFEFYDGKLIKLFDTELNSIRVIRDNSNNYWIIGSNQILCFSNNKLIKKYSTDPKRNLTDFSGSIPIHDSKNNIWISNPKGLIKLNINEIIQYEDHGRHIPESIRSNFDMNGNQIVESYKEYENFYRAFAIDHYDNIITGERIFDGVRFSNISSNTMFKEMFENTKNTNLPRISCCFVDNENNVWYGTNCGLIKATPIPFKVTDVHPSYNENDLELIYTGKGNTRVYHCYDVIKRKQTLKIFKKDSVIYNKSFNGSTSDADVNFFHAPNFFFYSFIDSNEKNKLVCVTKNQEINYISEDNYNNYKLLYKNNDSVVFVQSNKLILFTNDKFIKINIPTQLSKRLFFMFDNLEESRIILKDFTELKINKDLSLDTSRFFGINNSEAIIAMTCMDNPKNQIILTKNLEWYLLKDYRKIIKLKLNSIEPLSALRFENADFNYFREIITASFYFGEGVVTFFVDENKKEIRLINHLKYKDGLIDFSDNQLYYQADYVCLYNYYIDEFKIFTYNNFVKGNLEKYFGYYNYRVILDNSVSFFHDSNETFVNGYISYLGERGINLYRPKIDLLGISWAHEGTIQEITSFNDKIEIPYDLINGIFIDFKIICLSDAKNAKYKYRLLGLDESWRPEEKYSINSNAKYPYLNPGTYTFQVIACNNHGFWNEKPAEFSFTILPPWNRTWWAYTMYVFAGAAAIRGYLKNRTKKLEKEKQKLEKTVEERTAEIAEQKHLIEEKNKEITDSIHYAQKIQHTLLASTNLLNENLNDYFVLFKPKDIVSGDFYWAYKHDKGFIIITADCTGHGVPGAFMSLLSISYLNEITKEQKITQPDKVFNLLRDKIITNFNSDNSEHERKDGMDAVICNYNFNTNQLQFAAANNPLWLIRNGELHENKPDKMPVGVAAVEHKPFTLQSIDLQEGDIVYTITDGYADQFGGPKGKKFMYKQMKELIQSIAHLKMKEQKEKLESEINAWKGQAEQVDDILVIGIKI